jgi:hypothetical protein
MPSWRAVVSHVARIARGTGRSRGADSDADGGPAPDAPATLSAGTSATRNARVQPMNQRYDAQAVKGPMVSIATRTQN